MIDVRFPRVSRRKILMAGVAGAAAAAAPAFAQQHKLRFTLPWVAGGTFAWIYVAKQQGYLAKNGIDLDISRGFGSVAAAQSIAAGQFEMGSIVAPPLVISVAQGQPLESIALVEHDAAMGVAVLADSPIRKPADLYGKKIGAVPTSGEFPFFPAYCKKAGIDFSKMDIVQLDNKIIERALIEKQVDAILTIAGSSLPVIVAQGQKVRVMLYSAVGVPTYGTCITVAKKTLQTDPGLCAAAVTGLMEGLKFSLLDPVGAREIFYKAVPEVALSPSAKEATALSMGLQQVGALHPDALANGLGWANPASFASLVDTVAEYVSKPGTPKPAPADIFTNQFAGKVTLAADEWAKAVAGVKPYVSLMG